MYDWCGFNSCWRSGGPTADELFSTFPSLIVYGIGQWPISPTNMGCFTIKPVWKVCTARPRHQSSNRPDISCRYQAHNNDAPYTILIFIYYESQLPSFKTLKSVRLFIYTLIYSTFVPAQSKIILAMAFFA